MEVKDTNAKIWRKDYEGKNGTYYRYSVGVSRKLEDGSYANAYIPVKFSKKSGAPEKISNGAVCDYEGFMSTESYKNKEGKTINNPVVIVMKVAFEGDPAEDEADSFEQMEEEIPF